MLRFPTGGPTELQREYRKTVLGLRERQGHSAHRGAGQGERTSVLFFAARGTTELSRDPASRENVLGLRWRKRDSTHRVPGQGERPHLLFFTTGGGSKLCPGAEADPASQSISTAANAGHTPAAVARHTFTFTDAETVGTAVAASHCRAVGGHGDRGPWLYCRTFEIRSAKSETNLNALTRE